MNVGGTALTYAAFVTDVSNSLEIVQPYTTPVTGGSSAGWSGDAQLLQEVWTARNPRPAPR
jgi:hypothetical protein